MKKVLYLGAGLLCTFFAGAQNKSANDTIWKANGEVLVGKVTEVQANDLKFTYVNESLQYTLSKAELAKVKYASGRTETFGPAAVAANALPERAEQAASRPEDRRNKVAILPFGYIKNSQSVSDEMSYKAQNDTYTILSKHSGLHSVIDIRTTNTLLAKAGITRANLMKYTMEEICGILGVEFVVDGTITQNFSSATSSNTYNSTKKDGRKEGERNNSGYSNTVSRDNYQTSVSLNIYTDKNNTIFSDERKALFTQSEGSYDSPLLYLLKRTPLYKK